VSLGQDEYIRQELQHARQSGLLRLPSEVNRWAVGAHDAQKHLSATNPEDPYYSAGYRTGILARAICGE